MPYGLSDAGFQMLPLEDQIELARLNGDTSFEIMTDGAQGNRFIQPLSASTSSGITSTSSGTSSGSSSGSGTGGGGTTGTSVPSSTPTAVPAPFAPTLSLYSGGSWLKITDNPTGTEAAEKWIVMYQLPGGQQVFFEATPEQMTALFGTAGAPQSFGQLTQSELDSRSNSESWFFAGNVAEVETPTGESFQTAYERAIASGLGTGVIPEELRSDTQIQSLMFLAEHEDWSDDRLLEQVSKTSAFVTRFPEIGTFRKQGLDIAQSVQAYREYENLVNQLNIQYEGREATRDEINSLIRGQKSAKAIQKTYDIFERFEENANALKAFNEILTSRGMNELDADGMFDFLSGNAEDDVYEVYAESSVLEAGQAAGLGDVLSTGDVSAIVNFLGPDVPFERAFEGMNQAARLILQFRGDIDMGSLDPDDLIDLSLGVAPRSGRNQADIAQEMERSLSSARAFLNKRARFRSGPEGTGRTGFRKLRGESLG